jgi:hypothetical protein
MLGHVALPVGPIPYGATTLWRALRRERGVQCLFFKSMLRGCRPSGGCELETTPRGAKSEVFFAKMGPPEMGPPVLEPGGSKWMRRQHAHLLAGRGNWQLATESESFLFGHVADVVELEPTDCGTVVVVIGHGRLRRRIGRR